MRWSYGLILWGIALCASCEQQPARSSIVFVSIDTLSARHTSLYGYERNTTPGLDQLAQSSVVFERCWANAPWTTPSYMSQFTGLQAISFRKPLEQNTGGDLWALAPQHATLAELFQQAGYRTAGFVDNHNAGRLFGLERGFEHYDDRASKRGLEDVEGGIDLIVPLALDWLDSLSSDESFFLFVQVLDVHGPYLAGSKWKGQLAPSSIPDRTVPLAMTKQTTLGAIPKYISDPVRKEGQTELSVWPFIDAYDRGIRATDEALAHFVSELSERGILDRSWLVVSADHGESLVEHESYFNHLLLHGEELQVPLIMRPPGGTTARRVAQQVQLVDLLPSFLDMGQLPYPQTVHGRSLLPVIHGSAFESKAAFAFGDFEQSRCVVVDNWKLIEAKPSLRSSGLAGFLSSPRVRTWLSETFPELTGKVFGTYDFPPSDLKGIGKQALERVKKEGLLGPFRALYDLEQDPGEKHDLAEQYPQRVAALLKLLNAEEARARQSYIEFNPDRAIDASTRAELEQLGYSGE